MILAIIAAATAALFIYLNVMTVVQLFRKKLTIESLVFQSWQVILFILLFILMNEYGFSTPLYAMSVLGMWAFIPQLWSLTKGDESELQKKVKDTTPSPGPD